MKSKNAKKTKKKVGKRKYTKRSKPPELSLSLSASSSHSDSKAPAGKDSFTYAERMEIRKIRYNLKVLETYQHLLEILEDKDISPDYDWKDEDWDYD